MDSGGVDRLGAFHPKKINNCTGAAGAANNEYRGGPGAGSGFGGPGGGCSGNRVSSKPLLRLRPKSTPRITKTTTRTTRTQDQPCTRC